MTWLRLQTLFVRNWKNEATHAVLLHLATTGETAARHSALGVLISRRRRFQGVAASRRPGFRIGVQDCTPASTPTTGVITPEMPCGVGTTLVIVGHSERGRVASEGNDLIRTKAAASMAAGLDVILCVGETGALRMRASLDAVIR